ncbi:MAG: FIST C-terminal domain-containing protein [Gammaproteobacteria bacterium]|nr:FIST C-terminal domain-containing protein [Gammaproteobacteria bacterium]MBU1653563.1 FIST C-terminal domain-containing protein [Gammaproteobacteria bacterium]MBU1961905.1 FIST C-terminal domain-containing protein [Gammaproteobacteria bacterium]
MFTKSGVGVSHHRNPKVAAREACEAALKRAGIEGHPDFVFMFASVGYDQRVLVETVRELTGNAPLAGCSGEGIITQGESDEGNFTLSVMAVQSDEIRFAHAMALNTTGSHYDTGKSVAEQLKGQAGGPIIGMIILAEGLHFNYDLFRQAFTEHFPKGDEVLLFGGMAADNWAMKETFQYFDGQVHTNAVMGVLLTGSLRVAHSVGHGCVPIGTERTVTRSDHNVIYEIDGKPVLDILKEYLMEDEVDNWKKAVVNLSWGLKASEDIKGAYDEFVIRFMPARDEAAGSITIPTEIPAGTKVWMTRRDHDKIAKGVEKIGENVLKQLNGERPKMVFHFDCAGRGKVVFREQQKLEVLRSLQGALGADVPWIGFYTYGEIGPIGTCNQFHNYTLSLMVLY